MAVQIPVSRQEHDRRVSLLATVLVAAWPAVLSGAGQEATDPGSKTRIERVFKACSDPATTVDELDTLISDGIEVNALKTFHNHFSKIERRQPVTVRCRYVPIINPQSTPSKLLPQDYKFG